MAESKDELPPGVKGPIQDPIQTGYKKMTDVEESFPVFDFKSKLNPIPFMHKFFFYSLDAPVTMFRNLFDKMQSGKPKRFYHQKYRRVPEIWECAVDDHVCIYEAEIQFKKDKMVETQMLEIFENMKDQCKARNPTNWSVECAEELQKFSDLDYAWKVKYADLGAHQTAREVLNKQKNRFIEERYKKRMGIVDEERFIKRKILN